jgi:DNA-binding MarR family transcriptional regulator
MIDDERKRLAMEIHMLGFMATKKTLLAMESHGTLAEAGISMLQFRLLRTLRRGAFTISELSPILMVDPSTLVPAVDALERKGLAARGTDPNDRRRLPISLTDRGAAVAASHPVRNPFADQANPLVQSIDAMGLERAGLLLTLLREMVSHLPDGDEILDRVSAWIRIHSPAEHHPSDEA